MSGRVPGPGSPAWATAPAAVGETILFGRAQPGRAKWWGPAVLDAGCGRTSCSAIPCARTPALSALNQSLESLQIPFSYTPFAMAGRCTGERQARGLEGKKMPRKNSAVDALSKLEADRAALAARQRELEKEASIEVGQVILGSGLEHFSSKGLRRLAEALGAMGEQAALDRVAGTRPAPPAPAKPAST